MTGRPRTWAWLALVPERPDDADAVAAAAEADGTPAGWLAAWHGQRRPAREALRADARAVDPAGAAATVSLVLPPPGTSILFDDPAVQGARRAVLAGRPAALVTTLLQDSSHFAGALSAWRGPGAARDAAADPFARVAPARVLAVEAGLLGSVPPPAGPVIERYGSATPWPAGSWL